MFWSDKLFRLFLACGLIGSNVVLGMNQRNKPNVIEKKKKEQENALLEVRNCIERQKRDREQKKVAQLHAQASTNCSSTLAMTAPSSIQGQMAEIFSQRQGVYKERLKSLRKENEKIKELKTAVNAAKKALEDIDFNANLQNATDDLTRFGKVITLIENFIEKTLKPNKKLLKEAQGEDECKELMSELREEVNKKRISIQTLLRAWMVNEQNPIQVNYLKNSINIIHCAVGLDEIPVKIIRHTAEDESVARKMQGELGQDAASDYEDDFNYDEDAAVAVALQASINENYPSKAPKNKKKNNNTYKDEYEVEGKGKEKIQEDDEEVEGKGKEKIDQDQEEAEEKGEINNSTDSLVLRELSEVEVFLQKLWGNYEESQLDINKEGASFIKNLLQLFGFEIAELKAIEALPEEMKEHIAALFVSKNSCLQAKVAALIVCAGFYSNLKKLDYLRKFLRSQLGVTQGELNFELKKAVSEGNQAGTCLALLAGANPAVRNTVREESFQLDLIDCACLNRSISLVKILISGGAKPTGHALINAVRLFDLALACLLVDHGADVNYIDQEGDCKSPLQLLCDEMVDKETIKKFLQAGADVMLKINRGNSQSPISEVIHNLNMVEGENYRTNMLENGYMDPEEVDKFIAARIKLYRELLEMLIEYHLNKTYLNKNIFQDDQPQEK